MMNTNYKIGALDVLLSKDCLSERYYPLIPHKEKLISGLRLLGVETKNDAAALSDEALMRAGLPDDAAVRLFRRFLTIYDPNPAKFKEIEKLSLSAEEKSAFAELYCLPGIKSVRASLYYQSGYSWVSDFADATVEEVLERTARTIAERGLACIVPLPKEVRTHIAVARAFTRF